MKQLIPLTRSERIYLAEAIYAIGTLGVAITASEIAEEDTMMDNLGISQYHHQLDSLERALLDELREKSENFRQKIAALKAQVDEQKQAQQLIDNFYGENHAGVFISSGMSVRYH